jgi:D-3-phosphoglycerate dehydrogenase
VDVFTVEPVEKDNPLLTLNNLICMPHQAADTYETFESVAYFDAQVIIDVMEGKEPANWLNR